MIHIANIITEKEISNHEKKEWINYVVFEPSMHRRLSTLVSMGLPTLILGWNLYKQEQPFINNVLPNILYKDVSKTLSWEFSLEERLVDHFTGIEKFIKEAPRKFVERKLYRNIDPIKDNIQNETQLIDYLNLFLNLYHCNAYLYKDEIIYLYDRTRFEITGIYLNSYKYFGFNIEQIKSLIFDRVRQNQNNKATMDTDGTIYQSYYKQFPDFDQLKRSLVLFLS